VDLVPFFERSIQLVGGKVLRADKSYKAVKFVFTTTSVDGKSRGQGSTKAYDLVYTVMNEHNQIVSIHVVQSGDMKEVQVILE
jgi:NADH:ubiquinone oxidoreductase subunit C